MQYFSELLGILNAMSPYLLLGFFVAGLLHVYVPKAAFSRYLSKKGFRSVFLSSLFGVPLPLCSCGVIPTAMSLKKEGASDGATISFLISTPQTGVDSILATYGLMGLPFAIVRPIVALVVGVVGGLCVDRLSDDKEQGSGQPKEVAAANSCAIEGGSGSKLLKLLKYGFVDMLQDLGKWLTIGLIIAAAITVFVPESIFELFESHYLLNILVVLLLSVPMYICSTGSIPIALSLMLKGISPGAVLIFLMAGPATNVATLAVLKKVLGTKSTLLYLASIIFGAIAFAFIIDFALPSEWFTAKLSATAATGSCHTAPAWWQTASTILFVALLINAYILKAVHGGHSHEEVEVAPEVMTIKVKGMRCNHCKANVERALAALPNVESATADLTTQIVELHGNPSREEACATIKALGFEVVE